jgi:hypothetical protein
MKKIILTLLATLAFGLQNVSAQDAPIKIVTGHPDLKVKVNRCEASGNLVIIDLTFSNMNQQDAEGNTGPCTYNGQAYEPVALDNQGNKFSVKFKVPNQNDYSVWATVPLLSEIPVKVSLRIEGVPESSEFFSRLNLNFDCMALGLNKTNIIQIKNIPITRD